MTPYETACSIIKILSSHGFIAYFAGGWVRDFLMNHPSDDIDIATDAAPVDIQKLFKKTIPVGIQFGIIIIVEHGHQFEVATFRKDHGYEDGRRPIGIEKASPLEDAQRRDFTINGMFFDPLTETLLDFVNGQEDLHKRLIRAIGNPHQRFIEDRLRMMRAIRYSCRFHFDIEPATQEAIRVHANTLFPSVAIERVWQEFDKMKRFGNFRKFLKELHDHHLLQVIFPELSQLSLQDLDKLLEPLEHFPKEAPVICKIFELFPNSSLEKKLLLCEKFKLSNQDKGFVKYYHQVCLALNDNIDDYHWVHLYANDLFFLCLGIFLARLPEEKRLQLKEFHIQHQKKLHKAIHRVKHHAPVVTSNHLIQAGINPGVVMGKLLKEAEKISINNDIEDPNEILSKLKASPLWPV